MFRYILPVFLATAIAGAQTPFSIGIEMPCQVPVTKAVENALVDMGVGYVNFYVKPWAATPDADAEASSKGMLEFVACANLDFALSCYVVDPPDTCVQEAAKRGGRFKGIVFDEVEHCRLLNPHENAMQLADPSKFKTLDQAYEETLAGYRRLFDKFAALSAPVTATHVWPVLLHVAARAGFAPCPKICKEFFSPVSFAIGMGAALQYGRELCVDVDMWHYDLVPGHPPEEVESNLLLAYWLGADRVYLEGSGHNLTTAGQQGIPFSLMTQITPDVYLLTGHGEMLRGFIREYLPKHPRPWTFRDVRPDIAIIRFPDSDYGQRGVDDGQSNWHAGLYGTASLPPNADTAAWFGLWNLLTNGATGSDGITYFKKYIAAAGYQRPPHSGVTLSWQSRPVQSGMHTFFSPMNNVVVFDHLAGYDLIKEVPLLFLTGVEISAETMQAVRRRVDEGATAAIWGNLAKKVGFADYESGVKVIASGKGKFVLTDDFSDGRVWQECWPHMGHPDEIRYRFGEHTVVLRKQSANEVRVEVDGQGV